MDLFPIDKLKKGLSKGLVKKNVIDYYLPIFILNVHSIEKIKLLLEHEADINLIRIFNLNCLNLAVRQRYTPIVKLILDLCDVDKIDFYQENDVGLNALELACKNNDTDIVELLLPYYKREKLNFKKINNIIEKNNIKKEDYYYKRYQKIKQFINNIYLGIEITEIEITI